MTATIDLRVGDVREQLRRLPDNSIHCVITSPPYYGLRDYGTAQWEGGDPGCDHTRKVGGTARSGLANYDNGLNPETIAKKVEEYGHVSYRDTCGRCGARRVSLSPAWGGDEACEHEWGAQLPPHHPGQVEQTKWKSAEAAGKGQTAGAGRFCIRCGAWRGDLGLEPTPQMFVEHLVEIFREVRRVLRPDGVCFLNIGDSYVSNASGIVGEKSTLTKGGRQRSHDRAARGVGSDSRFRREPGHSVPEGDGPSSAQRTGLKTKDLCLVPQRLAIALQDDGWWVRSDIIWHKSNCMPESATDRPTRAHEYVWLLTKRAHYFWDKAAVLEPAAWERWGDQTTPKYGGHTETATGWIKPRSKEELAAKRTPARRTPLVPSLTEAGEGHNGRDSETFGQWAENGRNVRTVWTIPTESYPGAHFAVMARKLAETAIRAGTSEKGCCSICGKPWLRITERREIDGRPEPVISETRKDLHGPTYSRHRTRVEGGQSLVGGTSETVGWRSGCEHSAPSVPCTVLDPFAGSGTTMVVARRLGRSSIGIELNESYAEQARERLAYWWRDPTPTRVDAIDGQLALALDIEAADVIALIAESDGDVAADAGMADVGDQPGAGAA